MKKTKIGIALLGLAVLWTGCWQKSVHPFYKDKDVIFEERLLGKWLEEKDKDEDKADVWTFSRGRGQAYELIVEGGDTRMEFDARLFTLGGSRFLDLYSRKRAVSEIPAHHLFLIGKIEDALEIQILSGSWIKEWVTAHSNDIATVRAPDPEEPGNFDKGEFVLTADTDALQRFVLAHLRDEGFFDEGGRLRKVEHP